MTLVNSPDVEKRIEKVSKVSKEDIMNVSKKVSIHTMFILEAENEENNDK